MSFNQTITEENFHSSHEYTYNENRKKKDLREVTIPAVATAVETATVTGNPRFG